MAESAVFTSLPFFVYHLLPFATTKFAIAIYFYCCTDDKCGGMGCE